MRKKIVSVVDLPERDTLEIGKKIRVHANEIHTLELYIALCKKRIENLQGSIRGIIDREAQETRKKYDIPPLEFLK